MSKPKVLVLRAPGTNCEAETAFAFELAGGEAEQIHINQLMKQPELTRRFQLLCVPGGFSYGDDIAAGRILASQFEHHLRELLEEFRDAGKLILGICNGFQVLIKTGLLVPRDEQGLPVTLTWNDCGRYDARWVHLRCTENNCAFLRSTQQLYLPVAHAEGRFVFRDHGTQERLDAQRQLVLRYTNPDGSNGEVPFPFNPNGSADNVAGICDPSGRIFGLMPHPERYVDPTHHPRWTREAIDRKPDGLQLFENAIAFFR